jgi:hypothetical protein
MLLLKETSLAKNVRTTTQPLSSGTFKVNFWQITLVNGMSEMILFVNTRTVGCKSSRPAMISSIRMNME